MNEYNVLADLFEPGDAVYLIDGTIAKFIKVCGRGRKLQVTYTGGLTVKVPAQYACHPAQHPATAHLFRKVVAP